MASLSADVDVGADEDCTLPCEPPPSTAGEESALQASLIEEIERLSCHLLEVAGEKDWIAAVKTLVVILKNAMEHPEEEKYLRLRLKNAAFFQKVGRHQDALSILQRVGFVTIDMGGGEEEMILADNDTSALWLAFFVLSELSEAFDVVHTKETPKNEEEEKVENRSPVEEAIEVDDDGDDEMTEARDAATPSTSVVEPSPAAVTSTTSAAAKPPAKGKVGEGGGVKRKNEASVSARGGAAAAATASRGRAGRLVRPSRDMIAAAHEKRLEEEAERREQEKKMREEGGAAATPVESAAAASSKGNSTKSSDAMWSQLQSVRQARHGKWRRTTHGMKRVFTMDDVNRLAAKETKRRDAGPPVSIERRGVHTIANTLQDPLRIGLQALELTNEFRKKHGLPALKWHQGIADISVKHSQAMSEGKVPLGHDGFHDRVAQFPMRTSSAAENVAMNTSSTNAAEIAVDGWIHSPGHCKNLLSKHTYCGIGVYRGSDDKWYLTQMFAR